MASDSPSPSHETAAAKEEPLQATPRRGRRRSALPVAVPIAEAAEEETLPAPAALSQDDQQEETEAKSTKSRRRRGRRRRGQEEAVTENSVHADDLFPVEEAVQEEDTENIFFVPPPPPPIFAASLIVPSAQIPNDEAFLPRLSSSLHAAADTDLPQILIEGAVTAPYSFFVNAETAERETDIDSQIRQAAESGVHLFSSVMYLPFKNAYGERSYQAADHLVSRILAADPQAYIMPRLQFVPTNFWNRTHTDQSAVYGGGSQGEVSLASTVFWADCVEALEALIEHFSNPATPGGDRVVGYHLDRGEWFYDAQAGPDQSPQNTQAFREWLHEKYQALYALRAAWYDAQVTFETAEVPLPSPQGNSAQEPIMPLLNGPRDGRWVDYAQFSSDLVANVILGLAKAVKTLSAGRALVAVSYGYTLEFCTRNDSGHLSMGKILQSPDIDIVAGPNSYSARAAGESGAFSALVDSIRLHGKLYLVEDDTKTFLATEETPDPYNPRIESGAETQAVHQRHFGAALVHRTGVAWMDLWGQGWLNDPIIWEEFRSLRRQTELLSRITPNAVSPDVAVLVDEASMAYFNPHSPDLWADLLAKTRDLLLKAGASVGFYLQSDIAQDSFPDAKLYLFLNAVRVTTAERMAIRDRLQKPGKTIAWLYAPGLYDENGATSQESSEIVGMTLRLQPWNTRLGSQLTPVKHPITERLQGTRRLGQERIVNPSYAVSDPQATVLAEYIANGAASMAIREHPGGWKSFFMGDPHLSIELLRGLYTYAGVHTYGAQEDIIYAGDGALLIHTPFTGQRTLTLPRKATVYDAMENNITAADTRSFRIHLRAHTTRLFLWGERESILTATGLSVPSSARGLTRQETSFLPPPPEIPTVIAPPLSEAASEIAVRQEQIPTDANTARVNSVVISDLAAVLEMEDDDSEETVSASEAEETVRPRSRWQRRRAAARARREAERSTKSGSDTVNSSNPAFDAPLEIESLLSDLPPRRKTNEEDITD